MSGGPMGMSQGQILQLLRDPSGIAELLQEEHPETGDSPADIVADVINVMRADTKRIAAQHDVDVEANLMTSDRAAELLSGTVSGDAVELLEVFNELAEQRDRVLEEALDPDEYESFTEQKHAIMNTEPAE